ncbi:hypothetical protein An17g00460 [Aspergillus niger]|uniref:Uncharacterized protein n=2 Tax=Aspergillus niger TaxID=5061 RepID=A2R983_ASPNC|nr:hypothetical protein An17g00460 [Aspergillus niger]CAK97406.1 hypothetical protein An17g00460 [Aspergillus niger]
MLKMTCLRDQLDRNPSTPGLHTGASVTLLERNLDFGAIAKLRGEGIIVGQGVGYVGGIGKRHKTPGGSSGYLTIVHSKDMQAMVCSEPTISGRSIPVDSEQSFKTDKVYEQDANHSQLPKRGNMPSSRVLCSRY